MRPRRPIRNSVKAATSAMRPERTSTCSNHTLENRYQSHMFRQLISKARYVCPVRPSWAHLAILAGLVFVTIPGWGAQEAKPAAPPPPQNEANSKPADNKPAEFVGSATCQGCHEDIF